MTSDYHPATSASSPSSAQNPKRSSRLPIEVDGARILRLEGKAVFIAYVPSPKGAAFMTLIEKTFGEEVTTRTWDTVEKMAQEQRAA